MLSTLSKNIMAKTRPLFSIKNSAALTSSIRHSNATHTTSQNNILNRIGINPQSIILPKSDYTDSKSFDFINKSPARMDYMYGGNDLEQCPIFKGRYINFGYWLGIDYTSPTIKKRIESSKNLYEYVGRRSEIKWDSVVIDIGCGNGRGTTHLMSKHEPAVMAGLDINSRQIDRAEEYNKPTINYYTPNRLNFVHGNVTEIPFRNNSFTNVISVEALQHCDLSATFPEIARVLKPKGACVFTTFFAKNKDGVEAIKTVVPNSEIMCSNLTIDEVENLFSQHLTDVEIESIGKEVWPGFYCWLNYIRGYKKQWSILWPKLFEAGLLDYYVLKGKSPKPQLEEASKPKDEIEVEDYTPKLTM